MAGGPAVKDSGHLNNDLATTYCVNDQVYFCNFHLEKLHSEDEPAFKHHKTVPVQTNVFRAKLAELTDLDSNQHYVSDKPER